MVGVPTKGPGPLDGGFAPNTTNFISKLIFHPCSIPFQVYVETFIPIFIDLVLFITIPTFDDIIRERGEGIARDPIRGGGKRRRHIALNILPEPEGRAQRAAQQGLKTVLRVTGPLETIGYAFLLYAGVERFYYQWHSALYGFEHCGKPPSEGPYQAHSDLQGLPINPAGLPLFMNVVDQNRASWPASNQILDVPRGHYQVTLEATFTNRAINTANIGLEIRQIGAIPYDITDSGPIPFEAKQTGSIVISAHLFFPLLTGGRLQWTYYGDAVPVGVTIESCSVSVYSFQPGR